jgi:hypothetical protein
MRNPIQSGEAGPSFFLGDSQVFRTWLYASRRS